MFGGTPSTVTGEEVVGIWKPLMESLHTTQHQISVADCDLPKPWLGAVERPKKCVVVANAITTLIRKPNIEGEEQRNGVSSFQVHDFVVFVIRHSKARAEAIGHTDLHGHY